jgi:hypothetical protein
MKKQFAFVLCIALYLNSTLIQAQSITDTCYAQSKPLTQWSYRKMMRDHYRFTILGTQTPTSGFKVETTKPTITLKGNIFSSYHKEVLVNLELTAGLDNDLMQLFANKKLNGLFKANLGFNVMLRQGNSAKYILGNDFVRHITRKKVCEYREELAKQIDSLLILDALEVFSTPGKVNTSLSGMVDFVINNAKRDEYTISGYERFVGDHTNTVKKGYYKNLIVGMILRYGADAAGNDDDARFAQFVNYLSVKDNRTVLAGKMLSDIKRLFAFKDRSHKYHLKDDFEIETYKDIWTSKRIVWLNVSFTGANASFRLYDAPTNVLVDSNSFLPGVSVSLNFLKKAKEPGKYFFGRAGINVKRVNSLVDLTKFDYKKETIISVSPTEQLKSEKSGIAYQGKLSHGFGVDIPVEIYWAPWTESSIPGIYSKLQYSYGEPWINKNKISIDLGMVWNVTNSEKDSKNVLTIVPYMNWGNILKEYKDEGKLTQKKASELFTVGVKFGIPVSLGK